MKMTILTASLVLSLALISSALIFQRAVREEIAGREQWDKEEAQHHQLWLEHRAALVEANRQLHSWEVQCITRNGLNWGKGVAVTDFVMRPDGTIMRPAIEIDFRGTKQPKVELILFLPGVVKSMLNVFETMIAYLCGKNPRAIAGFPAHVGFVPEHRRRNKFVQYSFGFVMNGEFLPIG
jgi:hypothetical protein